MLYEGAYFYRGVLNFWPYLVELHEKKKQNYPVNLTLKYLESMSFYNLWYLKNWTFFYILNLTKHLTFCNIKVTILIQSCQPTILRLLTLPVSAWRQFDKDVLMISLEAKLTQTQTGKIKNEYISFCIYNAVMRFFYLRFLDILVQTFQNI